MAHSWLNRPPVLIAGGGIGGLAMANCLQRVGIPYKVIEATPEFGVAGYGIGLGHNAMNCVGKINPNLQKRINNIGLPSSSTFLSGPSGFLPMSRVNLQKELLYDIPDPNILLNSRVTSFEESKEGVTVQLQNGKKVDGSMLIGADGIKSSVRKYLHELYPNELGKEPEVIYTNFTLLGGETLLPKEDPNQLNDFSWIFSGDVIGTILPIKAEGDKQTTFWSVGVHSDKPIQGRDMTNLNQDLMELSKAFENTKFDYPYLINNAVKNVVWDIFELDRKSNCKKWGHGKVTLLGDAAHAVTPWVGQGAGISVEDAFDLTHRLLDNPNDIPKAIEIYEKTRIPRASFIQSTARTNMKLFKIIDNPMWKPFLKLYLKTMSIPVVYDFLSIPLLAYNKPEQPLPEFKK